MRWVAFFEDRPDSGDIRAKYLDEHLAYLRANRGTIVLPGPLRTDRDGAAVGGLWLFEAETRAEIEALIAQDPFQREGLRASSKLYAWGTAGGFEDVEIGPRG